MLLDLLYLLPIGTVEVLESSNFSLLSIDLNEGLNEPLKKMVYFGLMRLFPVLAVSK